MKKLVFYLIAALMATSVIFVACRKPKEVKSVSFDRTTVEALVGEAFQIVATVDPSDADIKTLNWVTSNSSVAVVSNGRVRPLNTGEVTITAVTLDRGVSASCRVIVSMINLDAVVLPTTETMYIDDTSKVLAVSYVPKNATYREVKWNSSNANAMTVDPVSGRLVVMDTGTSTITATSTSLKDPERTAICVINVPYRAVESMTLSDTTLYMGGPSFILKPVLTPEHAYNKVDFTSSNTSVVRFDSSGALSIRGVGTATITATTKSGNKIATCVVTVEPKPTKSSKR